MNVEVGTTYRLLPGAHTAGNLPESGRNLAAELRMPSPVATVTRMADSDGDVTVRLGGSNLCVYVLPRFLAPLDGGLDAYKQRVRDAVTRHVAALGHSAEGARLQELFAALDIAEPESRVQLPEAVGSVIAFTDSEGERMVAKLEAPDRWMVRYVADHPDERAEPWNAEAFANERRLVEREGRKLEVTQLF